MGAGIDFPLIMNYTDTDAGYAEPYFYFLNGHGDVTYFSDQNFTEEQIETYEYTPWGVLLTSANKNNLIYTAREFDFETGLQFNLYDYYIPYLAIVNYRNTSNNLKNFISLIYRIEILKLMLGSSYLNFEIRAGGLWKCCLACWIVHEILGIHCLDCYCCLGKCGFSCYPCEW